MNSSYKIIYSVVSKPRKPQKGSNKDVIAEGGTFTQSLKKKPKTLKAILKINKSGTFLKRLR